MNLLRSLLLSVLLSVFPALSVADHIPLLVEDAWVQEGPPNARVLAGFMQLTNSGDKPLTINAAHSKAFKAIEFHRTVHEDGMARMVPQEQLVIKPGSTLKLEHGGYHLMLMQPLKPLKQGDEIEINFKLAGDLCMTVKLVVRKADQHQHHHHH